MTVVNAVVGHLLATPEMKAVPLPLPALTPAVLVLATAWEKRLARVGATFCWRWRPQGRQEVRGQARVDNSTAAYECSSCLTLLAAAQWLLHSLLSCLGARAPGP